MCVNPSSIRALCTELGQCLNGIYRLIKCAVSPYLHSIPLPIILPFPYTSHYLVYENHNNTEQ